MNPMTPPEKTQGEMGIPCVRCGGTGAWEDVGGVDRACSDCLGTGEVPENFYDGDSNDDDRCDFDTKSQA